MADQQRPRWGTTPSESGDLILTGIGLIERTFRDGGHVDLAQVRDAIPDPVEAVAALISAGASLALTAAMAQGVPPLQLLAAPRQGAQHLQAGDLDGLGG